MPSTLGGIRAALVARMLATGHTPKDADALLMQALSCSLADLFLARARPLPQSKIRQLVALTERHIQGEPLAYLFGSTDFWDMRLHVTPAALIPRADTETLVEATLELLPDCVLLIADLGTGTGAIALALARERPLWRLLATDHSARALPLAAVNVAAQGVAESIHLLQANWLFPLADGSLDAIVANPPYIPANDPHLRTPGLRFEPREALVSEEDGMADLRKIIGTAPRVLRSGGWLLLEHAYDQAARVRGLFHAQGFVQVHTRQDLGRRDRVTAGRRELR